jgi:hypothetical protein
VRAIDLATADWSKAPPGLRIGLLSGPLVVATRPPTVEERNDTIFRGLAGEDVGMRPEFWLAPSSTGAAFARAAKPLSGLTRLQPQRLPDVQKAIAATGREGAMLGYLPILARSTDWSALIDLQDGSIVGYVPIDGF